MLDEQETELTTQYGDTYKMEVKTDGNRMWVVVTCNGKIIAAIIDTPIPRGPQEY